MSQASANTIALPIPDDSKLRLQTTMPSAIRICGGDSSSGSRDMLRLSQNRKSKSSTPRTQSLPAGWAKIKHPDAGGYYVHEELHLATVSNVIDSRVRSRIMEGANVLQNNPVLQALLDENQGVDLVLDIRPARTSYYCVSHVERRVFWLEGIGHEMDIPCTSNKCMKDNGSRAHCVEAQYWKHCEIFPTTFTVTKDVIGDLKDILIQAAADRVLAKFSTSPYDGHALERMLSIVKEIEADVGRGSGHAAWVVARFMALYNDGVLHSSYGQNDDYFDIEDARLPIGPYRRHIVLTFLGPLFFKSPDLFAAELYSFHQSFALARWSSFVQKVDQSITSSILLATVLLGANTGLLTFSDFDKVGGLNKPEPEQIIAYISVICAVGSIIIGLVISKLYRAKGADVPLRAVVLLKRVLKEPFGLETLAITCSLPYALLMWGLIAYLSAFGVIFYRETGIQVRIPVSLALVFVALCLSFCLYTASDEEDRKPSPRRQPRDDIDIIESFPKV